MNKLTLLIIASLLMTGCATSGTSTGTVNKYLNKAYESYEIAEYGNVILLTSQAENYEKPSHNMKAEIIFLKALALEKLGRNDEAHGIYRYLSAEFNNTEYGYKADEKLNIR